MARLAARSGARAVAEESRRFACRLSLLAASLPQFSMARALVMGALERPQTAAWPRRLRCAAARRLPCLLSGRKI